MLTALFDIWRHIKCISYFKDDNDHIFMRAIWVKRNKISPDRMLADLRKNENKSIFRFLLMLMGEYF